MYNVSNRNVEWEYLQWLNEVAGLNNSMNPAKTYSLLAERLYRKEFVWSVGNDDNRADDGLYLRDNFQRQYGGVPIVGPPSMFEVLISLSQRLAFDMSEENDDPAYWFHILLANANLDQFTDEYFLSDYSTPSRVDNILNRIIFRKYDADGSGGLFPLRNPSEDQRGVELWFQLAEYVLERSGYR